MEKEGQKVLAINTQLRQANEKTIREAGEIIRQGGLVAFPTETVYGLGANALNGEAVAKIFKAKGRPADNPLIVHIASISQMKHLVQEITPLMERLMHQFWPGPLSIIVKSSEVVPKIVTAGLETVAIRMPNHPVALALIRSAGVPIAAPSANISGRPSGTLAEHVWRDFNGKIDWILDGGASQVGLESTVVDCTTRHPLVLRPGGVTYEELLRIEPNMRLEITSKQQQPRSPGMKYTHYTPEAQVILVEGQTIAEIKDHLTSVIRNQTGKVALMGVKEVISDIHADNKFVAGRWDNLTEFAGNIYKIFRTCDQNGIDKIYVHSVPEKGLGIAIMNRLRKAANRIYKGEV